MNGGSDLSLTGKQKLFINFYLGDANYNSTLAARMAGYRASSCPISRVVGGLHGLGDTFEEYPFDMKWGCAISACFRFQFSTRTDGEEKKI